MTGTATQAFTLTVVQAPGILSAQAATAVHGKPFSFTFAAAGYPVPRHRAQRFRARPEVRLQQQRGR